MTQPRVRIRWRSPSGIPGYTTVYAEVDGGHSGEYQIADAIGSTDGEIEEILEQSASRMENIEALRTREI